MIRRAALLPLVLVFAACTGAAGSSPAPSPSPAGTPAAPMTQGQLRVAVMTQLGPRWWCDPDFYPIARQDEQALAVQRFGEMEAEGDVFHAVVSQLGLGGVATLSDAQKLSIYQLWKAASSFPFSDVGNGQFKFDYTAQPVAGATQGTRTTGTIDQSGTIAIDQQGPTGEPNCPICLARGTPIDTPDGPVAVEALRLGDPVWTLDRSGRRLAGVVIAIGSTVAPVGHHVIHLTLADGRTVSASPGHPLADGRPLGDIRVGDVVDGSRVVAADSVLYRGGETFDLIASGPTGEYFAGGIPMGSTLLPAGWSGEP